MTVDELYALFRSEMSDAEAPYLWADTEVFTYMDDAYKMFVRRLGGIPDRSTSSVCRVPVVAGAESSRVSPLILKFRKAWLQSSGRELSILTDDPVASSDDYGHAIMTRSLTPGAVSAMQIGEQRNAANGLVYWHHVPAVDDVVLLSVYRLPLDKVDGADRSFDFYEIGEEHHYSLLDWMKYKAYGKQDAETINRTKSESYRAVFEGHCAAAKAEWDRYKSKPRVVRYGGL